MATGLERLADADLRFEWANKHIERFESEIRTFHMQESYVVSEQPHIQTDVPGSMVVKLSDPPRIPPQLMLIAYDAIHNLRVALDYLACALAEANGKTVPGVYFPIAADIDKFNEDETQKKIKKLSEDGKRFIRDQKPYKGGWDELWAIHEIDKIDKHRNLVPFGPGQPMVYYTLLAPDGDAAIVDGAQTYTYRVALVPRFDKVEGFENDAALTHLKEFSVCVSDVLLSARNEFFPATQRIIVLPP